MTTQYGIGEFELREQAAMQHLIPGIQLPILAVNNNGNPATFLYTAAQETIIDVLVE